MERLTTDAPNGNFETMLNFVFGKDGWAYIRHDGEHENVRLTDWAKRQCLLNGCDEVAAETAEDVDNRLCDCMMDEPICPIAMAYCFASQAVHLRSRLKMYEDAMSIERARDLAQAEKDGRLVVLPCKNDKVYTIKEDYFNCGECRHESVAHYQPEIDRVSCDMRDKNTAMFPYSGEQPKVDDYGITWAAYRRRPEEGTA